MISCVGTLLSLAWSATAVHRRENVAALTDAARNSLEGSISRVQAVEVAFLQARVLPPVARGLVLESDKADPRFVDTAHYKMLILS